MGWTRQAGCGGKAAKCNGVQNQPSTSTKSVTCLDHSATRTFAVAAAEPEVVAQIALGGDPECP